MSQHNAFSLQQALPPGILWELRPSEFPGRIDEPLPAGRGCHVRLLVPFQYPDGRPMMSVYCRNDAKLKKGALVLFELAPIGDEGPPRQKDLLVQAVSVRQASSEDIHAVTEQFRHAKLEHLANVLQQKMEALEAEHQAVQSNIEEQVRGQRKQLDTLMAALEAERRALKAAVEQELAEERARLADRIKELDATDAALRERQMAMEEEIQREVGIRLEKQLLAIEEQKHILESREGRLSEEEQTLADWHQLLQGQRQELAQARARFRDEGGETFIQFLSSLDDHTDDSDGPEPFQDTAAPESLLPRMQADLADCGYTVQESTLIQCLLSVCVAASTGQFVILSGPTGVGKTSLAGIMARMLGAGSDVVPVRPAWIDPSDLLGFYNSQQNLFQPTHFMDCLLDAKHYSSANRLYLLTLDEMNLSRVENYAADFLSRLEKARAGEKNSRLVLYAPEVEHRLKAEVRELYSNSTSSNLDQQRLATLRRHLENYPAQLNIPDGLVILGTVNLDETTHTLSPKFLDRSFVVQITHASLPDASVEAIPAGWSGEPVWKLTVGMAKRLADGSKVGKEAEEIWKDVYHWQSDYLGPLGIRLGFRFPHTFRQYLSTAKAIGLQDMHVVASTFFQAKLLPWISFHRDDRAVGLDALKLSVLNDWAQSPQTTKYPGLQSSIERTGNRGGLVIRYLE